MATDLTNWKPRPRPERIVLDGRYVRLEPLSAAKHGDGLYEAATVGNAVTGATPQPAASAAF